MERLDQGGHAMNSNGQSFVGVQPDGGSFSQPNAFVLNEGVQHSAAMLRIFQNHDFARVTQNTLHALPPARILLRRVPVTNAAINIQSSQKLC